MSSARYFDGQSAQCQKVTLKIEKGNLLILAEASGQQLDLWAVKDLCLDPRMPAFPVLMSKYEPDARLELTDTEILKSLEHLNSEFRRKSLVRWQLGVLIAAFVTVLGLIFFGVHFFSSFIVHRIPFSVEQEIAKKMELENQFNLCRPNIKQKAALSRLLAAIYPALPNDNKFSINLQVFHEKTANAFTLPGGNILLTQGLIKDAESPAEIAGVLAHELAHVEHRHILQGIVRSTLLTTMMNFISYGSAGMALIDPGTASQLLLLKYSRSMEEEADRSSIFRLSHQRVDLQGYRNFFTRKNFEMPNTLSFLSTHPPSPERMNLIEKNFVKDIELNPVLSSEEFRILKTICL